LDGLVNSSEVTFGSDPYAPDSDYDGLSDAEELAAANNLPWLNGQPFNPWAWDTNTDGLSDWFEYMEHFLGFDPAVRASQPVLQL
jgi:hypothetical protein